MSGKSLAVDIQPENATQAGLLRCTRPYGWKPPAGPKWVAGMKLAGFVTTTAPYDLHLGPKDGSGPVVKVGLLSHWIERADSRRHVATVMRWAREGGDKKNRPF